MGIVRFRLVLAGLIAMSIGNGCASEAFVPTPEQVYEAAILEDHPLLY
jgi:hypothetical protein